MTTARARGKLCHRLTQWLISQSTCGPTPQREWIPKEGILCVSTAWKMNPQFQSPTWRLQQQRTISLLLSHECDWKANSRDELHVVGFSVDLCSCVIKILIQIQYNTQQSRTKRKHMIYLIRKETSWECQVEKAMDDAYVFYWGSHTEHYCKLNRESNHLCE